jgi:hypothetical protein
MTTTPQPPPVHLVKLDHILESAVVLNWKDLLQGQSAGLVQIEYHVAADRSVDCLKMWRSTPQGYSSLICNYSVNPGWSNGPSFSNGFHSRDLGRLLESIMLNQNFFQLGSEPNHNVVIQVSSPTPEQVESAKLQFSDSFPPPVPVARKAGSRRHPELPIAALLSPSE